MRWCVSLVLKKCRGWSLQLHGKRRAAAGFTPPPLSKQPALSSKVNAPTHMSTGNYSNGPTFKKLGTIPLTLLIGTKPGSSAQSLFFWFGGGFLGSGGVRSECQHGMIESLVFVGRKRWQVLHVWARWRPGEIFFSFVLIRKIKIRSVAMRNVSRPAKGLENLENPGKFLAWEQCGHFQA